MITPRTDDAGHKALLDEVKNAAIRRVEILGTNAAVVFLPRKPRLIRAPRVERGHVGIKSRHDLNDVEPFLFSIGGQRLEIIGPF